MLAQTYAFDFENLEDVLDFHRAEIGADLVRDRADQLERIEHDREFDPVGQLQRDHVAALHALTAQELGKALDLRPQLAVA